MKPPFAPQDILVEGVMTTLAPGDAAGSAPQNLPGARVNIAPMGPVVDPAFTRFVLRPFRESTTFKNLKATGVGVFHVTDDALLIARGAIGALDGDARKAIALRPAERVDGLVLADACRCYELKVESIDDASERTTVIAHTAHTARQRDFLGFNRARHAVLEAAILATRLHLTGQRAVLDEITRLQVIVDKTGADAEHRAMAELRAFVAAWKLSAAESRA